MANNNITKSANVTKIKTLTKIMSANLGLVLNLIPHWTRKLIKDSEFEASDIIKLLGTDLRVAVWNMCHYLGLETTGVPGEACRLLERYYSAVVNQFVYAENEWRQYKLYLLTKTPLIIACALMLSNKMLVQTPISCRSVCEKLSLRNITVTAAEIHKFEFEIYKMIGFRLPLWSSIDVAHMLGVEVGIEDQGTMNKLAVIMDVADCYHFDIHEKVLETADISLASSDNGHSPSLLTLHLCAGAVAASAKLFAPKYSWPTSQRLAQLTRVSPTYIRCIGDIIITFLMEQDDQSYSDVDMGIKRTFSDSDSSSSRAAIKRLKFG